MNFKELMALLGYEFKAKEGEAFTLIKKDNLWLADTVLLFDKQDKTIRAFLKPIDLINTLDDVSHIYELYRIMLKDAKQFADLTKYVIK
jgi:hypothetical protein